jgi:hypothetical protein
VGLNAHGGPEGEHNRPRRLTYASEEQQLGQTRLPHPLRRGWGQGARGPENVLVTAAEVTENLPMEQMLFRSTFRWGLRPRSVTGDAAYGTRENIAAIEKAGVRAYTALAEQGKRTALFTIEDFLYDAQRDLYTCPQGEILRRQGHDLRGGYVRYAVRRSAACMECPLKRASAPTARREDGSAAVSKRSI